MRLQGPLLEMIACGGVTFNADGSQEIVASCYGISFDVPDDMVLLLWYLGMPVVGKMD